MHPLPIRAEAYLITRLNADNSYSGLVAKYGQEAFRAACKEAKRSPLSVQDILERDAAIKRTAALVASKAPELAAHLAGK